MDVVEAARAAAEGQAAITLYVDDLTLSASGSAEAVTACLARATDAVVQMFSRLGLVVSVTRSAVVASAPALAKQTAAATATSAVRPRRHAKLLGTATAGGRRRSSALVNQRIDKFKEKVGRMRALRKNRANTVIMTRAAGTAAVTYGAECQGMAPSQLRRARQCISRAALGGSNGRNLERTFHVLDGNSGTLDPQSVVCSTALKHWASAWWEHWVPDEALKVAYEHAAGRAASPSMSWRRVTGPTLALWMSLNQLKWHWVSAHKFVDDIGRDWDTKVDPPCMIARAAKEAVTRARNRAISTQLPGLLPVCSDVPDPQCVGSLALIDLSRITARIAGGKVSSIKEVLEWRTEIASSLRSAATGAQWTHTRRCMVPAFGLTDKSRQLCHSADGTAAHRWTCPSTAPADGWTPVPPKAAAVANVIGSRRTQLLEEHGLLTVAVPKRAWRKFDTYQWISKPPDPCRRDLVWYVDGSGFNTRWAELATYGFGIAVVSDKGDLVAWGNGVPPQWTASASDAEAWAVATVLSLMPAVPKMVTDCLAILQVARAGMKKAGAAAMPLARVWGHLARLLDDDLSPLANGQLKWMPAHTSHKTFRQHCRSDGKSLSSVDWRANRLVDVLAKAAAEQHAAPTSTTNFLRDAEALVRFKAGMLGCVTHAANNCHVTAVGSDGITRTTVKRDATQPLVRARKTPSSARKKKLVRPSGPWQDLHTSTAASPHPQPTRRPKFTLKQNMRRSASAVQLQAQAQALEIVQRRLADEARRVHLRGDHSEVRRLLATELACTAQQQQLQQQPPQLPPVATTATQSIPHQQHEARAADTSKCTDEEAGCGAVLNRTCTSGASSAEQPRQRPVRGLPAARSTAAVSAALRRLLAG